MTDPFPPDCRERFEAIRLLASGGFGSVHLARQRALGRDVAVKLLHSATEAEMVARFRQEARVTAALQHPNVVALIDHGADGGVPWIAYEYLPGRSLRDALAGGPFDISRALDAIAQVGAALDAAHREGIVHRDVKPDNVMEAGAGHWKLADFGIARWTGAHEVKTRTGVILGTPVYLAPEVIAGEEPGPSADLYALAVMLYELLAGAPPFVDESVPVLLQRHLKAPPPPPSARVPGLPAKVDEVFARALAKDPRERPARAEDLVQAMRGAASGAAPARNPPSRAPRLPSGAAATLAASRVTMSQPAAPAGGPSRAVGAAVLAAVLLVTGLAALSPAPSPAPPPSTTASPPPAISREERIFIAELAGLERLARSTTDIFQLERVKAAWPVASAIDKIRAAVRAARDARCDDPRWLQLALYVEWILGHLWDKKARAAPIEQPLALTRGLVSSVKAGQYAPVGCRLILISLGRHREWNQADEMFESDTAWRAAKLLREVIAARDPRSCDVIEPYVLLAARAIRSYNRSVEMSFGEGNDTIRSDLNMRLPFLTYSRECVEDLRRSSLAPPGRARVLEELLLNAATVALVDGVESDSRKRAVTLAGTICDELAALPEGFVKSRLMDAASKQLQGPYPGPVPPCIDVEWPRRRAR